MHRIKKIGAAIALAGGLVAAAATPAAASVPSTFVTPRYEMTCNTGVSGSFGSYLGWASCYTPVVAKWKVRVDCAWGFSYDSVWIYTTTGSQVMNPGITCYWGVNDVKVIEGI